MINRASMDPALLRWMHELVGEQEILAHKRTVLGVLQEKKNWKNLQGGDHLLSQCMITQSHGFLQFPTNFLVSTGSYKLQTAKLHFSCGEMRHSEYICDTA